MTDVSHKVVTTPSPAPDAPPWAAGVEGRMDELYPRLSEDETKMVLTYGDEVLVSAGTRLWEVGERNVAFYLVLDGQMDILRRDEAGELVLRNLICVRSRCRMSCCVIFWLWKLSWAKRSFRHSSLDG